MKAVSLVLLSGLLAGAVAQAQTSPERWELRTLGTPRNIFGAAGTTCTGGVRLDDGSFENALRYPLVNDAQYVQKLSPASYPALLSRACVCWQSSTAGSLSFDVVVYDDDGPGGQPGTFLGSVPTSISGVPAFGGGSFQGVDCATLNANIASGGLYVGPKWDAASNVSFFICTDESTTTAPAQMYRSGNGGASWTPVVSQDADARALGVRAEFGASTATCLPSATALCLNNNRFRVEATYTTAQGQSGSAQVVKLTDETGYLWFFTSSNVEAVVKVLNACGLNQHYWVFAGGLTDVNVVLKVTDTKTGTFKTYTNPQGKPFQPIQDTAALASCP